MTHANVSSKTFLLVTVVAAITASAASAVSLALSVPVWAMFIGWIAFFTRGLNTRSSFENLGCVWAGLAIGCLASLATLALASSMGATTALPVVVFIVALFVVSMRGLPVLNNLLGYFLGLVSWFAAHLEPTMASVLHLGGAAAVGTFAGWVAHHVPQRINRLA